MGATGPIFNTESQWNVKTATALLLKIQIFMCVTPQSIRKAARKLDFGMEKGKNRRLGFGLWKHETSNTEVGL